MSENNGNPSRSDAKSDEALTVAMILDKSGSMEVVRDAVIEGFNDYLAGLLEDTADTYFSLTMFDTSFHHVFTAEPLAQVPALNALTYAPDGMTALYDAIGHTVIETDRRLAREGRAEMKVLVVVMTDGLENSSTDHTAASIGELVRAYEERGNWTFVYLGAGHDTIRDAQRTAAVIGYKAANAMRYEASPAAIKSSMASLAAATKTRRRAFAKKTDAFFADAGQSEQDYRGQSSGGAAPTREPERASKINSRSLTDALKQGQRQKRRPS
jgi:hypothetical protein